MAFHTSPFLKTHLKSRAGCIFFFKTTNSYLTQTPQRFWPLQNQVENLPFLQVFALHLKVTDSKLNMHSL